MNKKYTIKKAKGIFLHDIHDVKYYDLQKNSNILGHSYKKLTTLIKNDISSRWNILESTIYHSRMRKLFEKLFTPDYFLTALLSLDEFILKINNYSLSNSYNLKLIGERFNLWLKDNYNLSNIKTGEIQKNIIIYDMAEIFLQFDGDSKKFNDFIKDIKREEITVFNYLWYPYLDIKTDNVDIIILPEIYSGNFKYINILINKKRVKNFYQFTGQFECIPSLYISSSLKMYYLIKKMEYDHKMINLKTNKFIQSGRLFSYRDIKYYNNLIEEYFNKNIILSNAPPFYNYLPLILEDFQIKYLSKIII